MDEIYNKAIKDCLIPILSRFTNGISDLDIEVKKSFGGTEYYHVRTNDITMTPSVFKSLHIEGTGNEYIEDEIPVICWRLCWRWECFSGGSNGTELITISTFRDLHYGRLTVKSVVIS